ncbi:hypothetical protein Tco_0200664 [Tanacetum coccineum]
MAQQIIPAAQLIVGKILFDHLLSYAITVTTDVPSVYLQQFWQTVYKVPNTKDTIRFKLNTREITYTVDMFRDTLKLPVETLDNPFVAPVNIETIGSFMQTVGYQGVVDKVSAFYTKFLDQPWQTMFKVFNRYLTTKTSGHDQIKINILQLFHVVVNRTNVDYAALLWWDFTNNVFQKKNVIQYPRFIKLIIADLMEKYPSIPRRLDEVYHSIKDDTPLGKKRKQRDKETSSPRKPQKVTIRQKKQSTPSIPPPGDDRERDEVAEATILILTLHKTALAAEA